MWLVKSVMGKGVNRVKQLDSYLKKKSGISILFSARK